MNRYLFLHLQSAYNALVHIIKQPFSSILSLATLALALTFPLTLHLIVLSTQDSAAHFTASPQISMFMELAAKDGDLATIHRQLKKYPLVKRYTFIGKRQALEELEDRDHMRITSTLIDNPLPDVFVITPVLTDPKNLVLLQKNLAKLPMVQQVQFDMRLAKRLYELVELGKTLVFLLSAVLGLAMVLITYYIIYMQILGRKEEIAVAKLIGASDYFIRRSFFYHAFWQSLAAAFVAHGVTVWLSATVNPVIQRFADLYHEHAVLRPIQGHALVIFIVCAIVLSLIGARFAVGQHLRKLKLH